MIQSRIPRIDLSFEGLFNSSQKENQHKNVIVISRHRNRYCQIDSHNRPQQVEINRWVGGGGSGSGSLFQKYIGSRGFLIYCFSTLVPELYMLVHYYPGTNYTKSLIEIYNETNKFCFKSRL